MLRLILMRHAKSDWSHADLPDHNRPLNKRGEASADAMGDWLRSKNFTPDHVLCSSAERTGQTLLHLDLAEKTSCSFARSLYHAEASDMLHVLQHEAKGNCVLMLGHNPGICEMANRLVVDPPAHDRFYDYPTAATLVCDLPIRSWDRAYWETAEVVDFAIPREVIAETQNAAPKGDVSSD